MPREFTVKKRISPNPLSAAEVAQVEQLLARFIALAYLADHPLTPTARGPTLATSRGASREKQSQSPMIARKKGGTFVEPTSILGLLDVLKVAGFDPRRPGKLIRHQDARYPVDELRRQDWLELYQSYQGRPILHDLEQVVSFYGLPGTRAGFYGVYKVLGHRPAREGHTLEGCPWSFEWHQQAKFFYTLERDPRFDGLRDRLIVDWGLATRSWVQKVSNKPVLEIQEPGRRLPPFDDYLEFSLTFAQLKDLFANEEAHREWRARLSAVGGVYLILAETSGDLYVGSASGEGGVWGRWRQYAASGDGGNALLRDLIQRDAAYPDRFRFSLLQVLPKTMARDEISRRESFYKVKLGSRAKGLNLN